MKLLSAGYKQSSPEDVFIDARIANIDQIKTAEPKKYKFQFYPRVIANIFIGAIFIMTIFSMSWLLFDIIFPGESFITLSLEEITIPAGESSEIQIYLFPKDKFHEPNLDSSRLDLSVIDTYNRKNPKGIHIDLYPPVYLPDHSISQLRISVDPNTEPGDYIITIDDPLKGHFFDTPYIHVIVAGNESIS